MATQDAATLADAFTRLDDFIEGKIRAYLAVRGLTPDGLRADQLQGIVSVPGILWVPCWSKTPKVETPASLLVLAAGTHPVTAIWVTMTVGPGAAGLTFDLLKNGVSVFLTPPTIPAVVTVGDPMKLTYGAALLSPAGRICNAFDGYQLSVTAVDATTPGQGLLVGPRYAQPADVRGR